MFKTLFAFILGILFTLLTTLAAAIGFAVAFEEWDKNTKAAKAKTARDNTRVDFSAR